jgi:hypothetical protein
MTFILHHPAAGVYLGNCLGMGFWSKWDPVGQTEAVTFDSQAEALEHIQSWHQGDENNVIFRKEITIHPVHTKNPKYATITEIEAAGFPGWNPDAKN